MPTTPLVEEGHTIEPSVSVPRATADRLADTAAPDPELEPQGLWSSTYGFAHWPARPDQPLDDCSDRKFAHSDRFALPRMTAPASRSPFTTTGMPCSGPLGPLLRRSRSSRSAIASASGLTSITELSWTPERSICLMRWM